MIRASSPIITRHCYRGDSMTRVLSAFRALILSGVIFVCLFATAQSQSPVTNDPPYYGPFNAVFLSGGDGLRKPLIKDDSILRADSPWSLYAWVRPKEALQSSTLVAGFGDPSEEFSRYLVFDPAHVILWMGQDNVLSGPASLAPGKWQLLAATFDGDQFRLYADGTQL